MVGELGLERIGRDTDWDYHTDFCFHPSYNCCHQVLNLGERQTDLLTLLQSAQGLAGPGPDLSQIGGADSPLHIRDVDINTPRKVEVVNLPEMQKVVVTNEKLNVEHVGALAVTQGGEWVIQLASGQTIPVYVQSGHVTADIAGGLEGLAIQLADEEVGLRSVGAL